MPSPPYTGGLESDLLSKTTSKAAEPVNGSKLIGTHLTPLTFLWKELDARDLLQKYPWT